MPADLPNRRPLKSRSTAWAGWLARLLTRAGIAPNVISFAGILFACAGAWAFLATTRQEFAWGWIAGALCVQLRLLCNLMDGMVAVEGNRKSATGELWNEVPDRFADVIFLVAAGVAAGAPWIGVAAGMGALLTAYLRALGASITGEQDFRGPMAKPHRMALLTISALAAPFFPAWPVMQMALGLMTAGIAATCLFRLKNLAARMREDSGK